MHHSTVQTNNSTQPNRPDFRSLKNATHFTYGGDNRNQTQGRMISQTSSQRQTSISHQDSHGNNSDYSDDTFRLLPTRVTNIIHQPNFLKESITKVQDANTSEILQYFNDMNNAYHKLPTLKSLNKLQESPFFEVYQEVNIGYVPTPSLKQIAKSDGSGDRGDPVERPLIETTLQLCKAYPDISIKKMISELQDKNDRSEAQQTWLDFMNFDYNEWQDSSSDFSISTETERACDKLQPSGKWGWGSMLVCFLILNQCFSSATASPIGTSNSTLTTGIAPALGQSTPLPSGNVTVLSSDNPSCTITPEVCNDKYEAVTVRCSAENSNPPPYLKFVNKFSASDQKVSSDGSKRYIEMNFRCHPNLHGEKYSCEQTQTNTSNPEKKFCTTTLRFNQQVRYKIGGGGGPDGEKILICERLPVEGEVSWSYDPVIPEKYIKINQGELIINTAPNHTMVDFEPTTITARNNFPGESTRTCNFWFHDGKFSSYTGEPRTPPPVDDDDNHHGIKIGIGIGTGVSLSLAAAVIAYSKRKNKSNSIL